MWNSPRFCFNSYLELDRRMRMRVRCAAWQLWVSEKFSSLSVVYSKRVYTRNTPRAKSTYVRTDTWGCSEPPATAVKVFPSKVRVYQWSAAASITGVGAVGFPRFKLAAFRQLLKTLVGSKWPICVYAIVRLCLLQDWKPRRSSEPKPDRIHYCTLEPGFSP